MKREKPSSFKYRVQRQLENEGFTVAPVADSTIPIDLLAFRDGQTRGYRCRAHGRIYNAELQKIREFARRLRISIFITKVNGSNEITMSNVESYGGMST